MNETNLQKILISIAQDRGFTDLAKHIEKYLEPVTAPVTKLNITKLPEATCDGCQ